MGVRETLRWAKGEWGIIAKRDDMSPREMARWVAQWVPFGARTAAYGTVSLTLGPLTSERAASTWAMKAWSRASLDALDVAANLEGAAHVPTGGVLYASNHQSLLDILVLGALLPGDLKWAAKRSLMSIPFLGWHLRLAGHVPVDRRAGRRAAAAVIERFEAVLRDDKPLLVFPEGTRSEDGAVKPFKSGGFYAAVRAGRPVVPVALDGTHRLMDKHAADSGDRREGGRRVLVAIGAPIHPESEGKERARVERLRDATQETVEAMHRELRARLEGPGRRAPGGFGGA
ncbi:MAG: lysophospholipid acyltransferase family protein [Myxococcota bacterium]